MLTSVCIVRFLPAREGNEIQKLYSKPDYPKPATQPSCPDQLSLIMHSTFLFGKTQVQEASLIHLSFPCPSLFPFPHFSGGTATKKKNLELAVASMPKINLSNSQWQYDNRKRWMCLGARLQCRELLLPWAPKNLINPARRGADYQSWSHALSASLTRDMALWFPFMNYALLKCGKHTEIWNILMRCSDL